MIWSTVENLGLVLISFGSLVLYSRMLSASEFGVFAVVLALIELIEVMVRMFFHDALVQRKHATDKHFDTAFTITITASVIFAGICIALAPWFAVMVDSPRAAPVLAWMTLCFPCGAITATIVARQRRELSFKALALRSLMGRLTGAAVGLGLVLLGAGVWGLVAQQVLILAVGSLVLWIGADHRPRLRFGMQELRDLWSFSLLSTGTLLLNTAVKRVFTILAGAFIGVEAAGILNLAMRTADTLYTVAASAVSQVAMPMLAGLQSDRPRLIRAYRLATAMTCAMFYGLFFGLAVCSTEVVELMFGSKWTAAGPYVAALSILTLFQAPRLLMNPLLTAIGRPAAPMLARGLELTFVVITMLLFKPTELHWAMGIWMAREAIGFPAMAWLVSKFAEVPLKDQLRGALGPLIAAVCMVAVGWSVKKHLIDDWANIYKLVTMSVIGASTFLLVLTILDRKLIKEILSFAKEKSKKK